MKMFEFDSVKKSLDEDKNELESNANQIERITKK